MPCIPTAALSGEAHALLGAQREGMDTHTLDGEMAQIAGQEGPTKEVMGQAVV